MAAMMPTVHKDVSLISLVPKLSGAETAAPLEEFLSSIEGAAKIGRWDDADRLQVAILRLSDNAKAFYNIKLELHAEGTTWEEFKIAFRNRFKDPHTDQYHFTRLQTARQFRKEGPQEFADHCRMLAQKVMCRASDAVAQPNTPRKCRTFVSGKLRRGSNGNPRAISEVWKPSNHGTSHKHSTFSHGG
jgi:hypothetical protein